MTIDSEKIVQTGREVLAIESAAIEVIGKRIGKEFVSACELCLNCKGRIVVLGMGKSGHVASKIAATLASTGSPAFFVHPGEASHGDLGMIIGDDVVIALSNSGETQEVVSLMPLIKRLGIPLITITGNPDSTLSQSADVNLDVSVDKEACPLNLAPTASTSSALAMGDALAIALLETRGFTSEDFARSHPGGSLGRRLLLRVEDIMHSGEKLPRVTADTTLSEALLEMSRKGMGLTAIVDDANKVLGVFTDGDLRRAIDRKIDIHGTSIRDVMTANCRTATIDMLAGEVLNVMEQQRINGLLIVDSENMLVGVINMHDLLRAGIV